MRDTLRRLLDDVSRLNRLSAAISSSGGSPPGAITAYGGSVAPDGWVLCDGSTYDGTTTTYEALWGALGTAYGGTGQSAFQVPDLRGRAPFGVGTNADVSALGASDGLAVGSRSPVHNHTNTVNLTLPDHVHSDSISFSDSGHGHSASPSTSGRSDGNSGLGGGYLYGTSPPTDSDASFISVGIGTGFANLSKSGSVGNPTAHPAINGTILIGPGGSRPNNAPGYLTVQYIVKL